MIGKVKKMQRFDRLTSYLTKNSRASSVTYLNLSSAQADEAAAEMTIEAAGSKRCAKPAVHLIISYPPSEKQTDKQMNADAVRLLADLGLSKNQTVTAIHRDADGGHDHIHIVANRVSKTRAWDDGNSFARVEKSLRKIEAERNLRSVAGRHTPAANGERFEGQRTSKDPRQIQPPPGVKKALAESKNWEELTRRLHSEGWKLQRVQRAGQKAGLILVGPDRQRVAPSKIERSASLANLEKRFATLAAPQPKLAASPTIKPTTAPPPKIRSVGSGKLQTQLLKSLKQRPKPRRTNQPLSSLTILQWIIPGPKIF